MAHDETDRSDRRSFLQAGALATASAMTLALARHGSGCPCQGNDAAKANAGQNRHRNDDARAWQRRPCASAAFWTACSG